MIDPLGFGHLQTMTCFRALACSWLALALVGCADPTDDSGDEAGDGNDTGEVDPPLDDAALRCAATLAPELAAVGPTIGSIGVGPCGHAAYHDDQGQGWLIGPDGTRDEFVHASNRVAFAPTGDMLAWQPDESGPLLLRDLLAGESAGSERTIADAGTIDAFGFVPSFADPSARGAWLWSCEQGVLSRSDASSNELVAESVVCARVAASTGSPRLAYADLEGRVWIADLDAGTLVASDDLDWVGYDGSDRDDSLWIDHDGEVVQHLAIEWQGDPDADSEWPVELWSRVLDREGAVIFDEPEDMALRQAPRRGAPVFVLRQGVVRRLDAGAPSSVGGGLESAALAGSGELFYSSTESDSDTDEILALELDVALPPTAIGQFETHTSMLPSRGAAALSLTHHSEVCIVDALGECERILIALRRWDREAGLAPHELLSTTPWTVVATLDQGDTLAVGAPVEAEGPIYTGEEPTARVLWLDPEGEIQSELPAANGNLAVRQSFWLDDDRVLFEYQSESGQGALMLAEAGQAGFVSLAPEADVALLQTWIDARAERVVFVAEQAGATTLWFGALPQ
ncbi:hypothetical protein ACNOYE_29800 [Nannocystaceae bacterium ST9]